MRERNTAEKVAAESAESRLSQLFEQFTVSGKRLEERYEQLRKESEALKLQLRQKELEIKQAQKLATLGETAAAIAHEVRNPLGALKLFTSLLHKELPGTGTATQLLEQMNRSICALENVVSNILQFSRSEKPHMAPLNVHAIISEQIEQSMAGHSADDFATTTKFEANPFIFGNEHGLRRVFTNVLLNAIQAQKGRGSVSIHSKDCADGSLRITFRDSGPGFSERIKQSLFEPFATTKNEGTGLGLAIVKQVVESHGGSVHAENNGGAEITIVLPRRAVSIK